MWIAVKIVMASFMVTGASAPRTGLRSSAQSVRIGVREPHVAHTDADPVKSTVTPGIASRFATLTYDPRYTLA